MDAAHTNKHLLSDYIYGIPLISGIILKFIWSHSFGDLFPFEYRLIPGIVCLIFSLYLILAAKIAFKKLNQPSEPQKPTTQLVTYGVYKIFRNPMYLSLTFLLLGVSFCFDIPVLIPLDLLAVLLTHFVFVLPEEKYLLEKFGREYETYKEKSRRWL